MQKQIEHTGFEYQVVAEIKSVAESIIFFSSNTDYDLIFMDIHLEDGNCFKILNEVLIEKPIIFCTTFDTYAIEAFKYNSIDYLIKPVKKESIEAALAKYWTLLRSKNYNSSDKIDKMMDFLALNQKHKKRFLVRKGNKQKLVKSQNILCFYSTEGDTKLIEQNGNEHIIDFTMERLEKLVNPTMFFRINRKIAINIDYIYSIEDYFNNRLKIRMEKNIPLDLVVSRNRVKDFKLWLKGVS